MSSPYHDINKSVKKSKRKQKRDKNRSNDFTHDSIIDVKVAEYSTFTDINMRKDSKYEDFSNNHVVKKKKKRRDAEFKHIYSHNSDRTALVNNSFKNLDPIRYGTVTVIYQLTIQVSSNIVKKY